MSNSNLAIPRLPPDVVGEILSFIPKQEVSHDDRCNYNDICGADVRKFSQVCKWAREGAIKFFQDRVQLMKLNEILYRIRTTNDDLKRECIKFYKIVSRNQMPNLKEIQGLTYSLIKRNAWGKGCPNVELRRKNFEAAWSFFKAREVSQDILIETIHSAFRNRDFDLVDLFSDELKMLELDIWIADKYLTISETDRAIRKLHALKKRHDIKTIVYMVINGDFHRFFDHWIRINEEQKLLKEYPLACWISGSGKVEMLRCLYSVEALYPTFLKINASETVWEIASRNKDQSILVWLKTKPQLLLDLGVGLAF